MSAPNLGSLAKQKKTQFNKMYDPRLGDEQSDEEPSDESTPDKVPEPYDESMDLGSLTKMVESLTFNPTQNAYTLEERAAALALLDINPEQVTAIIRPNINVGSLLNRLFILVMRLPIESARLFDQTVTSDNMNIIKNNILNMIQQILLLIKIIITIPSQIGKTTKQIYSQFKYISIGMLILIIITIMLYQTPATQPFMIFMFDIIRYLSGVHIPTRATEFIEFLKQQTLIFFSFTAMGRLAGQVLSESAKAVTEAASQAASQVATQVSTQVSTEVSNNIVQTLRSNAAQKAISDLLSDPRTVAALTLTVSAGVGNQIELVMNDIVSPQLKKIQDIVVGTSDNVIALNIKSDEMRAIFNSDLLLIKESIYTIENGQEITEEQLNKALILLQKNLQTTDLGRIMNANGVIITHDNVMTLLRTAQSAVEAVLGRNVQGQYMLKNEGGRRTRRNRKSKRNQKNQKNNKTLKKRKARKSKRNKRSKIHFKSKKK
jgi:hypothetical protein